MLYILPLVTAMWTAEPPMPQQKPVVDSPIIADVYDLPTTLNGLIARADAVVVARITRVTDVSQGGRARTDYRIELVSVVKEHANLGTQSVVCRAIGRVEQPNRVLRVYQPNLPDFEQGREYLLFLSWQGDKGCFTPAFGPPGAAVMEPAGLKPFAGHPALRELEGMKAAEVSKRLAQAASAK
jgi:hypothetical protein